MVKQPTCTECKWRPVPKRQADKTMSTHQRILCHPCEIRVDAKEGKHEGHETINLDNGTTACITCELEKEKQNHE